MRFIVTAVAFLVMISFGQAIPMLQTVSNKAVLSYHKLKSVPQSDTDQIVARQISEKFTRNVRFQASIAFTANAEVWLFVNEVEKGYINDPKSFRQVNFEVSRGDVIGIKAKSTGAWHGVAANVAYEGGNYPSVGNSGSWKAKKSISYISYWGSKKYSSCKWSYPVKPDGVGGVKADKFPYSTGAEYVWASMAGDGDQNLIWLRHVVGVEDCEGHQTILSSPRKRLQLCDIRKGPCSNIWNGQQLSSLQVQGNSESSLIGTAAVECRCQPKHGAIGKCYRMQTPGSQFGRCDAYICATAYECVKNGGQDLQKCVRRVAKTRVVPYAMYRNFCRSTSITPKEFYVLSAK